MKDSPDWDALTQQHLDGQTTEQEAAVLSEQIIADAEVRSRYLKAAQVHGALADEVLALELETEPDQPEASKEKSGGVLHFSWPQQIAASLVAGALVGLLGVGVVWAVNSPKSEASIIPIANGDFQSMSGPVEAGFPNRFGYWSGNPAEVVEKTTGNRTLRFLETGNVMGNPGGGASNCSVFQLIDLTSLRRQWDADQSASQLTLELSARFYREKAPNDADLPKLEASIRIFLLRGELESIENRWPELVREADALGKQSIKLAPGDEAATLSASCLLNPEATIALIAVAANTRSGTSTPIKLGSYFVDDVQLIVIKQPNLPVRFVK